jgi:hypothetical protein
VGIIKDIRGSNNEKRRYGSNCMSNKEKNKPEKDHADDACYFYGVHTDGRLDSTENPELMSITIEYIESVEDAKKGKTKKRRLWVHKEDAEKYGTQMIHASLCRTLPPGW